MLRLSNHIRLRQFKMKPDDIGFLYGDEEILGKRFETIASS